MHEQRRLRPGLGTYVELGASGPDAAVVAAALAAGFEQIDLAQARWSFHAPDSELTRLNRSVGVWVPLSRASYRLLQVALGFTRLTGALFNCTVGGALVGQGVLPDHGGPASVPVGNASDVELDRGHARLRRPVRITLDGIAKGWAIDLACRAMRSAGASGGWVNAGGDLRVFGSQRLTMARRELDGTTTPMGTLQQAALASSAVGHQDADRFPGVILGSDSLEPGVWTVLARQAWRADALTKVAAVAPAGSRHALVNRWGGALWTPA